ncbi:hypothetical protein HpKG12_02550 [Helicobacter pylori]
MGGLKRYLKNAKNRFTHLFLTILIQKTTPIKWFLSLKRNDLKNVFFVFSLNGDN